MGPWLEDKLPILGPNHDFEHFLDQGPDVSYDCLRVHNVSTADCWQRLESHDPDEDELDEKVSTNSLEDSYHFLDMHQPMPDTQRNSTHSQAYSEKMATILHRLDEDLPDTQRNVVDYEDTLPSPPSSQVPGTQRGVFQNTRINEDLVDHRNQFLQGSPTQLLDVEQNQETIAVGLDRQLEDTQRNEFSDTSTDIPVNDNSQLYWPGTQPHTPQWMLSIASPTILPPNESSLISDIKRNNDTREATRPTTSPHMQLNGSESGEIIADTQYSSADNPELPNIADISFLKSGVDSKSPQTLPKVPHNKVNCRERKRIIVSSSRPPALTKAMCQWVDKTNYLLDPFREEGECWFHPSPPPAHLSMNGIPRPCGKLQKRFNWNDRHGKHSLVLNFGIACKLVNYKITKQQKDGFINKQWHLSHLCGNWTCLNPAHTTVEPGNVNISRNNCFSHRSGCLHNPPCMKDKKVPLGADGKLVDHTASMASNFVPVDANDWDDWSVQGFDDGDDLIMLDGNEDSEVSGYKDGGDSFVIIDGVEDEL